jgi:hypothetical protein
VDLITGCGWEFASGMPLKVKGNEYLAMDLPHHWIYIDNFKLKKRAPTTSNHCYLHLQVHELNLMINY